MAVTRPRDDQHDAERPRLDGHRGKPRASHVCRGLLRICGGSRPRGALLWALARAMTEATDIVARLEAEESDLVENWGWAQTLDLYDHAWIDVAGDGAIWVVKTFRELAGDTEGRCKLASMPAAVKRLVDAGLVKRQPYAHNRALHSYQVDRAAVAEALRSATPCPWLLGDFQAGDVDRSTAASSRGRRQAA